MFSQRAQKSLFDIRIPNKTCVFFSFCFFALLDLVRVHAQAGPWGRPHAAYPIRPFERTFFTLQKKPLLSKGTLEICTRARPKTLPKKVPKNSFGGLSWAKNTETGQKNEKVCNLQKLFLLERARIESCIMRGTLSGRRPRDNHGNVLWKKTCFFSKTCVFQFKKALGANFGASLRRPNWPCLEYLLLFYKLFLKSDPAYLRDAISA